MSAGAGVVACSSATTVAGASLLSGAAMAMMSSDHRLGTSDNGRNSRQGKYEKQVKQEKQEKKRNNPPKIIINQRFLYRAPATLEQSFLKKKHHGKRDAALFREPPRALFPTAPGCQRPQTAADAPQASVDGLPGWLAVHCFAGLGREYSAGRAPSQQVSKSYWAFRPRDLARLLFSFPGHCRLISHSHLSTCKGWDARQSATLSQQGGLTVRVCHCVRHTCVANAPGRCSS